MLARVLCFLFGHQIVARRVLDGRMTVCPRCLNWSVFETTVRY